MPTRRIPNWLWTAAALTLGLALRYWFITHAARIAGDTLIYGEIAKNWMQHGVYGFVETAGVAKPTLIRLPGYPLFLIACFRLFGPDSYTAVMYVQTAIDLSSCLLLSALAGRLFDTNGSTRARTATLWLACLCPFTASYVAAPLTETLTLGCIALTFYALERWNAAGRSYNRWLWIITASLAYSILLRPEQGLLAAAVIPAMLWLSLRNPATYGVPHSFAPLRKGGVSNRVPHSFASLRKGGVSFAAANDRSPLLFHKLLPILTAALLILLPLVPWTLRNAHTFHVLQPLAPRNATDPGEFVPLGFQRWYRTWAIDFASTEDVYWNYDGATIQIADLPDRAFDAASPPGEPDQYTRTEALLNDYNETSNATPEFDTRFSALAAERIAADPLRYYIALPAARVVDMALRPRVEMFPTPLAWWRYHEHPAQTLFAGAYAILNLIYLALAGWGIALWQRARWAGHAPLAWAMLASVLLRTVLLLTLDNSEPRYTLEFFPIVFLLAAIPFAKVRH